MERDNTVGSSATPNDHSVYNEEDNMDRAAQAGVEGAFDADPSESPTRAQMREDAEEAFGGSGDMDETGGQ